MTLSSSPLGLDEGLNPFIVYPIFMTYQLTPLQERVLNEIAQSECRDRSQMLSMIMSEGLSWMYMEKGTYLGDVEPDTTYCKDLLEEIEGFHAI